MVVICAGTTGYNATVDLRYLWMRQKRLQGSHFANDEQSYAMNHLAMSGTLDPCMSRSFGFDELPGAHQLMHENRHPHGNMAILVGAQQAGAGTSADNPTARSLRPVPTFRSRSEGPQFPWSAPLPEVIRQIGSMPRVVEDDGAVVSDLMTGRIVSCSPTETVHGAASLMTANRINAVVVMNNAEAVGVVSQTDVVLALQGRTRADAQALPVQEVMTEGCVTCDVNASLSDAITTMTALKIHRLVVTRNEGGRDVPVGLLSLTDIVRKLMLSD